MNKTINDIMEQYKAGKITVEEAMTAADSAKEAYVDFVRDEAAHQFSKV